MLPQRPLDDLLGTPALVKALRVLSAPPLRSYSGRELARIARIAPSQATLALKRLEAQGVVWREVVGRADRWTLAPETALGSLLSGLFLQERSLRPRMLEELRRRLRRLPVSEASVFGSVARGDATERSDLDLFVRVKDRRDAEEVSATLLDTRVRFLRRFGTELCPLVYTDADCRDPPNPRLLENIRREGVPMLGGGT